VLGKDVTKALHVNGRGPPPAIENKSLMKTIENLSM